MPNSFIRSSLRALFVSTFVSLVGASIAQTEAAKSQTEIDSIKPTEWTSNLAPSLGSASAPIQIVFFVDYQCPSCRTADPQVREAVSKRPDVALIYREFPLHMHQFAKTAAIVAENARVQGTFEVAHKALMDGKTLTQATLKVASLKANVSTKESASVAKRLESDHLLETKAKLNMVPCFIVIENGKAKLMNKQHVLEFLK